MSESEQRPLEIGLRAIDAAEDDLGHRIDNKPSKREVIRIAAVVALVGALLGSALSIGVSVLALGQVARQESRTTALGSDVANSRELAEKAYQAAQAANSQLTARGQTPVPVPPPTADDPTSTIVAASAARVLAQLPPVPTAQQVAQKIAADQLLNPPAVPVAQISAAVASYLQANPPPKGDKGEPGTDGQPGANGKDGVDGQPGPPPSDAQIQAAFVTYVQEHPDFLPSQLCANYGQNFNQAKDLVAQDGTRYTLYGCITSVVPPPVTTTTPSDTPTETTGG
jgi:hypothetical protein